MQVTVVYYQQDVHQAVHKLVIISWYNKKKAV